LRARRRDADAAPPRAAKPKFAALTLSKHPAQSGRCRDGNHGNFPRRACSISSTRSCAEKPGCSSLHRLKSRRSGANHLVVIFEVAGGPRPIS